jgi:branched-chain amino acid transport system permease protein
MSEAAPAAAAARLLGRRARIRPGEWLFWAAAFAALFLLPDRHLILNSIAVQALFALSYDLVLGFAGIVSLGHAAFFGVGAYAAGLMTKFVTGDPLLGLAAAGLAGGVVGFASSFLLLRGSDLTRLMVSLGVALILAEIANKAAWLTGGTDGFSGMAVGAVLGRYEFDIFGHVAFAYSLCVLFVLFVLARIVVHSPFGLSIGAIHHNPLRARAVGVPVNRRLVAMYTFAAIYAGIAGGLLAQTTQFVSLDVLDFNRSADVLLMLVIGGTGYLYGGMIGAALFVLAQDQLASLTPQYWHFWIGLALVVLMLVGRERFAERLGAFARLLPGRR